MSIFNILNMVKGGVYISKSESIAIRNGKYQNTDRNTGSDVYSQGNTGMLCQNMDRNRNRNRNRIGTGTGTGLNFRQ